MKINKLLISTAFISICFNAHSATIAKNTARFQAMDKITGTSQVIEIPVNGQKQYEDFSIVVRQCKTNPPEETPESYAFVDIAETNSDETLNIYKGWMLSSSPALNPLEHPMYDLWLLECFNKKETEQENILSQEELNQRDGIDSIQETEYALEEPAPQEENIENKEDSAQPESIINIIDSQIEVDFQEPKVEISQEMPFAKQEPAPTEDKIDVANVIAQKVQSEPLDKEEDKGQEDKEDEESEDSELKEEVKEETNQLIDFSTLKD